MFVLQTYERRIRQYVHSVNPAMVSEARPTSLEGAVDTELSQLNQRYCRLLTDLHRRLHCIKQLYDAAGIYFPVSAISRDGHFSS